MTRALITGVAGMVGSHLTEYLLANTDWNICGMLRWQDPLDNLENVTPLANRGERVRFVYADLGDTMAVQDAVAEADADYVFHLAAQSDPKTSFVSPLDTLDTNVQGTVRLLDAIRRHRRHQDASRPKTWIHVCSSSEVYGRVPKELVPIKETCPFHPASPYAVSKIGADLMAQHYAQAYGMNIQITRMFTHTGPRRGDIFAESSFAKQIAMIELGLIPPTVMVGNLESLRTIADVRDAVRAYHMLSTVNPVAGAVYNVGGSHSCKVGDILEHLLSLTRVPIKVQQDPQRMRPLDADLQVPDFTKFKSHTGWEPTIPFEQTMADLLAHWREKVKAGVALQR